MNLDDWKPTIADSCDVLSVELSPDEGHLLVYIDGETSFTSIVDQTGMPPAKVRSTISQLYAKGVLAPPPAGLDLAVTSDPPIDFDEPTTELPLDQLAGAGGAEVDLPPLVMDDSASEDEWEESETLADSELDVLEVDDGGWGAGDDTNVEVDEDDPLDPLAALGLDPAAPHAAFQSPLAEGPTLELEVPTVELKAPLADASTMELPIEQEFDDVSTGVGDEAAPTSSPLPELVEDDDEEIVLFSTSTDEAPPEDEEIVLFETSTDEPDVAAAGVAAVPPVPSATPESAPEPPPPPASPPRPTYERASVAAVADVLPIDALDVYGQLKDKAWRARAEMARQAQGAALQALCLDPDPEVISALFDNPAVDVEIVKLMARAQRSDEALIVLGARSPHVTELEVQALLLGNTHTPEGLLQMILGELSLDQLFAASIKQQLAEPARELARSLLRERFVKSTPHVRSQLVLDTAGACLAAIPDFVLDEDTADLLAHHKYTDAALVSVLAENQSTPLRLLQILYRQPVVLQTPSLREALISHPNWPTV